MPIVHAPRARASSFAERESKRRAKRHCLAICEPPDRVRVICAESSEAARIVVAIDVAVASAVYWAAALRRDELPVPAHLGPQVITTRQ